MPCGEVMFWLFCIVFVVSGFHFGHFACFGGFVSLVSVVSFRLFGWFRWFRFACFVSLFQVLVHAVLFSFMHVFFFYFCYVIDNYCPFKRNLSSVW